MDIQILAALSSEYIPLARQYVTASNAFNLNYSIIGLR